MDQFVDNEKFKDETVIHPIFKVYYTGQQINFRLNQSNRFEAYNNYAIYNFNLNQDFGWAEKKQKWRRKTKAKEAVRRDGKELQPI